MSGAYWWKPLINIGTKKQRACETYYYNWLIGALIWHVMKTIKINDVEEK
jgi:hypothetical protein